MPTQEEWDAMKISKRKGIVLGRAQNTVLQTFNYKAVIEDEESRERFKEEVLALYRVLWDMEKITE